MKPEEYEAKLAELQAQIDELRNERIDETNSALPMPPHPRWSPAVGEEYSYICNAVGSHVWFNDEADNKYYDDCNIFKTREAAKFAVERMKVIAEMQEWAGKWDDDFIIVYNGDEIGVSDLPLPHVTYGIMRFASRNDAINCIKTVGEDRIKKYYFMIQKEEKE